AFQPNGTVASAIGGTLALASNFGPSTRNEFAVVPEVGVNVGARLNGNVRLFAGYSFLYWSNVVRPGDQVDRVVNANLIPVRSDGTRMGPSAPVNTLRGSDFWAHGINLGMQVIW